LLPIDQVICFGADGHRELEEPHTRCCCGHHHAPVVPSSPQVNFDRSGSGSCLDVVVHLEASSAGHHQSQLFASSQAAEAGDFDSSLMNPPLPHVKWKSGTTNGRRLTELRSVVLLT
jgi:hypothetical protein